MSKGNTLLIDTDGGFRQRSTARHSAWRFRFLCRASCSKLYPIAALASPPGILFFLPASQPAKAYTQLPIYNKHPRLSTNHFRPPHATATHKPSNLSCCCCLLHHSHPLIASSLALSRASRSSQQTSDALVWIFCDLLLNTRSQQQP